MNKTAKITIGILVLLLLAAAAYFIRVKYFAGKDETDAENRSNGSGGTKVYKVGDSVLGGKVTKVNTDPVTGKQELEVTTDFKPVSFNV